MTGWLFGWVIFSNEFALIFQHYTFFAHTNLNRCEKCVMRKPLKISGVEFIAICLIYVKR